MCPRFAQAATLQELRNLFGFEDEDWQLPLRFNIRPTDPVMIIRLTEGRREPVFASWWLIPPWADAPNHKYPMFNARAESLLDRKAYAEPARNKRCLIPMTGWFEFHPEGGIRQPYYFSLKSSARFAAAGLWQVSARGPEPVTSCTMVTVDGNPLIARYNVKNRMPALVPEEAWDAWLDTGEVSAEHAVSRLASWPEEDITVHAVDRDELKKTTGDGPACIEPWPPASGRD